MKKALLLVLALCFAGTLVLAQDAAKPADEKSAVATEAVTETAVVSDEVKDKTGVLATSEEAKDETTEEKTEKTADVTMEK